MKSKNKFVTHHHADVSIVSGIKCHFALTVKKKRRKHTHKSVKAAIFVTFIYDINNLYYCTCTTCVFCTAVPGEVSWYWGGSYHHTCKTPVTILFYLVFFPHHDHQTLLTFSSHIHLVIYFSLFKVFVPDTSCWG